jgi:hypothetical protein
MRCFPQKLRPAAPGKRLLMVLDRDKEVQLKIWTVTCVIVFSDYRVNEVDSVVIFEEAKSHWLDDRLL